MIDNKESNLFKQKCIMAVVLVLIMAAFVMLQIVNAFTFDVFTGLISTLAAVEISTLMTKMGRPNYKNLVVAYPILVFISFFLITGEALAFFQISNISMENIQNLVFLR